MSDLTMQIKRKVNAHKPVEDKAPDGNIDLMISTGSTLLDLAISGGRVRNGGIPGGTLVEIFGPSGAGKTVLLCEIAGAVKRKGGEVMFHDPEARLNKQFAKIFDLDVDETVYGRPNTVPEVFEPVRSWKPKDTSIINGVFGDSMAALSTDMEREGTDKYGMRRAKEFSEELRKTCRVIAENNLLMVVSNQVRVNVDAQAFQEKYSTPGGMGLPFYASLRLKVSSPQKIRNEIKLKGKKVQRVIGVRTEIEVYKSSIWKPFRKAYISILFDYGIDDIRENLQFVKDCTGTSTYTLQGKTLDQSMDGSIAIIEENGWERKLKKEVIQIWNEVEEKFDLKRKLKKR